MRRNFVSLVSIEWDFFENTIGPLMQQLQPPALKTESFGRLNSSINQLFKIFQTLTTDTEYLKKENPDTFTDLMNGLEEALRTFFKAYSTQENLQGLINSSKGYNTRYSSRPTVRNYKDNIDSRLTLMYDSLCEKRGIYIEDIQYGYPSVLKLVRFLRNLQHHEEANVPTDYRTQVKSFGNIYTFSCILILTFYAYVEMLRAWTDTLRLEKDKLKLI